MEITIHNIKRIHSVTREISKGTMVRNLFIANGAEVIELSLHSDESEKLKIHDFSKWIDAYVEAATHAVKTEATANPAERERVMA